MAKNFFGDDRSKNQPNNAALAQSVAQLAYEKFLARGQEHGHDLEDWLAAESEVNDRRPFARSSLS